MSTADLIATSATSIAVIACATWASMTSPRSRSIRSCPRRRHPRRERDMTRAGNFGLIIDNRYRIECDKYCFRLQRLRSVASKGAVEDRFTDETYHSTLQQVAQTILRDELVQCVNTYNELSDVITRLEALTNLLTEAITKEMS